MPDAGWRCGSGGAGAQRPRGAGSSHSTAPVTPGRFALTLSQHIGRYGSALLIPQVPREAWGCGSRAVQVVVRVPKRSARHSGPRASRCELCGEKAPSALALLAQIGRKQHPQHHPSLPLLFSCQIMSNSL